MYAPVGPCFSAIRPSPAQGLRYAGTSARPGAARPHAAAPHELRAGASALALPLGDGPKADGIVCHGSGRMTVEPPVAVVPPKRRWFHRVTTILLVIFCFELG